MPLLRERGHEAQAIDLPAHGEDRTPPWQVTLDSYAEAIGCAAERLPDKPILVGHSMGGAAITQAAGSAPDAYAALVYLCAFAPLPGEFVAKLGVQDTGTLIHRHATLRIPGIQIRAKRAADVFYNTCPPADAAWATARLRPDPLRPLLGRHVQRAPIRLARAYIECSEDRAVSLQHQRWMADRIDAQRVATLKTDHSPFLSAPEELADALDATVELAA